MAACAEAAEARLDYGPAGRGRAKKSSARRATRWEAAVNGVVSTACGSAGVQSQVPRQDASVL